MGVFEQVDEDLLYTFGCLVFAYSRLIVILVSVVILFPLCSLPSIDKLKITSFIALICIVIMVAAITYTGIDTIVTVGVNTDRILLFGDFMGVFISLPIIGFAFTFHPNILPIWQELEDGSRKTINVSVGISVISCVMVYGFVATFGYLTFVESTPGNILNGYTSTLFDIIKYLYSFIICFSYPVLAYPAKYIIYTY